MRCFKPNGADTSTILGVSAELDGINFGFVQILKKGDANAPKRMLRFTVYTLPAVQTILLVNISPQPFDELGFLWLSADVSENEVALLDRQFFTTDPLLYVHPAKRVTSKPKRRATAEVDNIQLNPQYPGSNNHILGKTGYKTGRFCRLCRQMPARRWTLPAHWTWYRCRRWPWQRILPLWRRTSTRLFHLRNSCHLHGFAHH